MTRILLVDDDSCAVQSLQALLEMDGYEVRATMSSVEALELLGRERFDVVVTDLEMPRVHGVEVVRAAIAASPATRVYVVSAYQGSAVCKQAVAAGAERAFTKPLDYDKLVACLPAA